ncbi:MAG: AAA family ATPase [Muribaculaceae bacterium]|nr:AAA family ATPase [Muribaculaceae bacterium]
MEGLLLSVQMECLLESARLAVIGAGKEEIDFPHVILSIFDLEESVAAELLKKLCNGVEADFARAIIDAYAEAADSLDYYGSQEYSDFSVYTPPVENTDDSHSSDDSKIQKEDWRKYVVNINENLENRNPLIGREAELDRTIQVLCRKDKNNPLHIGDPGVGKTALVYGLAQLINDGNVPDRLKGCVIYGLDLGTLLAGTQFRGDFEKRLKMIMQGVAEEMNAIIYIDEIHTLVGAGAIGNSAMDASNMLKPYLEKGNIRFIGSTTHDEYKRYFARSKGLVRRFSIIDIIEPGIEETIEILNRLKGKYEEYHGVRYLPEAIEYAVRGSVRHISDRFLPDKAIDLIDESGAYRQAHKDEGDGIVDKALVADILSKICKVDSVAINNDSVSLLETLQQRLENRIYGQDDAVRTVTEAVQMSKAGLSEENKPLASLLFVGPTGVGKTELAKALAEELGIGLVRFDMSEYVEKHAVAKLIGSPAGYVGYEDGGLLTDAIRKTPDCVLLLDEIEKAHSDIYNILLQVMDYGRLTDNKGNKADFTNVVIIMTSNAGARFASRANVGFASTVTAGNAMLNQVKKTFQPEFMNRLSATVVFNDMDEKMASLVLDKKLGILQERLKTKKVSLNVDEPVKKYLLSIGFSREYGAREMDRAVNTSLKPLLMREILFGKLKDGGEAHLKMEDEKIVLEIVDLKK